MISDKNKKNIPAQRLMIRSFCNHSNTPEEDQFASLTSNCHDRSSYGIMQTQSRLVRHQEHRLHPPPAFSSYSWHPAALMACPTRMDALSERRFPNKTECLPWRSLARATTRF